MHTDKTADILTKQTLAQLDLPLGDARGLPPKAYTSPVFFQQETEALFRGGWMSVAFSHDIPNSGDAIPLSVAGVELIVVRDKKLNVRVFHNVCRHRASTVLQAPATGLNALRCNYHCWSYELTGELLAAPMWVGRGGGRLGSLDAQETALTPVRCGEWQDLIFVNIDGKAAPLEQFVLTLDQRWQCFDLAALTPFAHSERVIDANWKVVLEGYLEVYHEACLHKSLGYRLDADGKATWQDIMEGDLMGFTGALPANSAAEPSPVLQRVPGMPTTGPGPVDIMLLFPSTTINVLEDHVVRTIWTPISPTQTRWRSAWYFVGDASKSDAMRATCDSIVAFWHEIRSEDLGALLRVQKGLSSWDSSAKEIRFSPFWEEILRYFQRHIARRIYDHQEARNAQV